MMLTKFALCQAVIIFAVGWARGIPPLTAFIQGFIIITVANVPQGLPSTITAALHIVAKRMGKHNVFVKKLDVIETLGSCSLICTDKTGTLTQNLMSVANLWVVGGKYETLQVSDALKSSSTSSGAPCPLRQLLDVATLNSRVALEQQGDKMMPNGDATELGFYRFCTGVLKTVLNIDIEAHRTKFPKLHEIPFNSSNKWQMSIHRMENQDMIFLKGAPDVLLSKCAYYLDSNGDATPVDEAFRALYTASYEEFGGQGERVLGFAMKPMLHSLAAEMENDPLFKDKLKEKLVGKCEFPMDDLCFVGLISLIDPPRDEVPQAVRECHSAGVKVVMVTGDHPLTAAAIAHKIGMITLPTRETLAKERNLLLSEVNEDDVKAVVVHGTFISEMTESQWNIVIQKQEIVFARTSPEQKLIIVKKFTEAGNVVAMTGDGVNDSPALKQAAIGIAMGMNGSDVAREAADIVLLDDNFASIVVGIKEGRLLFANLKKSIA